MPPTVKIDEERKAKLDRFVASLLLEERLKVTLHEALGLMVDYSIENKEEIIKRLKKLPPLEDDPAWRILRHPDDWKIKDASERVDEYLYVSLE